MSGRASESAGEAARADGADVGVACNLCGGVDAARLADRSRSGAPLRTVICRRCGLVWSDPRPHDARAFYEESYRLSYKGTLTPKLKHVHRAGLTALSRLERLRALLPPSGAALLDVGSGGGEFVHLMSRLGWQAEGIEPNRGYAEYSRRELGLAVEVGFVQDARLTPDRFDVITVWHVLEHTEDPSETLARLFRALRPGGLLAVEVPNVLSASQSPRSAFHEAHLFNFCPATLRQLAVKNGFRPLGADLSADGGNVLLTARKPAAGEGPPVPEPPEPANFRLIYDFVTGRSALRHALTPWPYVRLLGRLRRTAIEAFEAPRLAKAGGRRALLDGLYAGL
ncbi:MAG: class I SAM-dependent methyltransferase [Deltaproteobacteria bacterium]|jgi:SAM-dependent methyltransferase|nr:class I SAM-dependent methyltransferase [Deltaproteobacteria bacterium]